MPTIIDAKLIAKFTVRKRPHDPEARRPYARADYRQWVAFLGVCTRIGRVERVQQPCRVVASVYVARPPAMPIRNETLRGYERGVWEGLVDSGVVEPHRIQAVEIRFTALPPGSPDTRTEIEIYEAE